MKVYKRPDSPIWWATLRDPQSGQRKRVSLKFTGSKARATVLAGELEAQMKLEAVAVKDHGKEITVREAVDEYLEHLAAHGKVSVKIRRYNAAKLFGYGPKCAGRYTFDGATLLHDVTPIDMERIVRARLAEGNSAQTIHHELSLIRSATRHAAGLGYRVPRSMTDGVVRNAWRMPTVESKTRYLSWEEFQRVYAYLDPDRPITNTTKSGGASAPFVLNGARRRARQDCQDLLVALTMCGGRWSEVSGLTWDRVDFEHSLLRLWGNKDKEERLVPMPPQFAAVLTPRRMETRHPTSPIVFCRTDGRQRTASSRGIGRAMTECGLNREDLVAAHGSATVHSLRHTFASWLIQNGADLSEVQDALGHATLQMTRRYAALAKRKTVSKLGGILERLTTTMTTGAEA